MQTSHPHIQQQRSRNTVALQRQLRFSCHPAITGAPSEHGHLT